MFGRFRHLSFSLTLGYVSFIIRRFRNPFEVIWKIYRRKYPVIAIYRRTHERVALSSAFQIDLILNGFQDVSLDISSDILSFRYSGVKVMLFGAQGVNGDPRVFIDELYRFLTDDDVPLVDVGANIGDSSIYFAIRGVKKVVAVEPYPSNYYTLLRNISINKLSNVITPLNAGVSGASALVKIPSDVEATAVSTVSDYGNGPSVRILTLSEITDRFRFVEANLKLDCEGCEFDTLLNSDISSLRRFRKILAEMHSKDIEPLVNRLRAANFEVNIEGNYLFATRLDES